MLKYFIEVSLVTFPRARENVLGAMSAESCDRDTIGGAPLEENCQEEYVCVVRWTSRGFQGPVHFNQDRNMHRNRMGNDPRHYLRLFDAPYSDY